ncbi:MAG: RNA-binding protein [Cytophagales bacterium]|nr:MAG: RNA-binding protein [Cytophagales bacterium]
MNIYVANLNYKIDNDKLRSIFEEYGEVSSAKVIFDHQTGRSRGFGFVEMDTQADAENAIENLNGAEVEGKVLTVNEARPKKTGFGNGNGNEKSFNKFNKYKN